MTNTTINARRSLTFIFVFFIVWLCLPSITFATEYSSDDTPDSWRYSNGRVVDTSQDGIALHNFLQGTLQGDVQGSASLQSSVLARGIDVSEWQGDINWQAVKNSGQVDFVIIRCGFAGTDHDRADYKWERNASECERLGIPYGVYVYSYARDWNSLNSLVSNTTGWIGGHTPTYPVFIDMEDNSITGCGRQTLTSFAKSFCDQIQSAGFVGGVYSSTNWYNNVLYGSQLDNYVKWVAQWNSSCTYSGSYAIWQYTSKGSVPGISGNVDMNYLYNEVAVNESRFQGVYDFDFYMENNPDVARVFGGNRYKTLMHFITCGMSEHRQAAVTFNYDYYKGKYRDLQNAFGNDSQKYYYHFLSGGMNEGRSASEMFDCTYYKNAYGDLRNAFGANNIKYYYHFLSGGMSEGRRGSSAFSLEGYYNRYRDLRSAFGGNLKRYYQHYVIYGKKEGRQASDNSDLQSALATWGGVNYSLVYDINYYINKYADLKKAFTLPCNYCVLIDDTRTMEHFVCCGMNEGRQAKDSFKVESYYNRYQDLRKAFRSNLKEYYKHYIACGKNEGRVASNCDTLQNPVNSYGGMNYSLVYDGSYYVNKYADLKKAFSLQWHSDLIDDVALLEHFVYCGMNEGRQAKDSFKVESYYNRYQDLRKAFRSNLKEYYKHYIACGKNEGRVASNCDTLQNPVNSYGGMNYSLVYDGSYYVNKYADLKKAFSLQWHSDLIDDVALLEHFVYSGMNEGRQAKESFSKDSYYNEYPDLRAAFGKNWKSYYLHYIQYGFKEGRNTTGCNTLKG